MLKNDIGGSQGGRQGHVPLPGPNSFIFMHFLGKNGQIIAFHLHLWSWHSNLGEILDPPLNNIKCLCCNLSPSWNEYYNEIVAQNKLFSFVSYELFRYHFSIPSFEAPEDTSRAEIIPNTNLIIATCDALKQQRCVKPNYKNLHNPRGNPLNHSLASHTCTRICSVKAARTAPTRPQKELLVSYLIFGY